MKLPEVGQVVRRDDRTASPIIGSLSAAASAGAREQRQCRYCDDPARRIMSARWRWSPTSLASAAKEISRRQDHGIVDHIFTTPRRTPR